MGCLRNLINTGLIGNIDNIYLMNNTVSFEPGAILMTKCLKRQMVLRTILGRATGDGLYE